MGPHIRIHVDTAYGVRRLDTWHYTINNTIDAQNVAVSTKKQDLKYILRQAVKPYYCAVHLIFVTAGFSRAALLAAPGVCPRAREKDRSSRSAKGSAGDRGSAPPANGPGCREPLYAPICFGIKHSDVHRDQPTAALSS